MVDWMDWMVDWMVDWMADRMMDWIGATHSFSHRLDSGF